jgi:hypothetical protein
MNRLPSLVPVLTGALAASAGALLLLGWHGRTLTGAFAIAAAALGIVPLVLLFRMAAATVTPGRHRAKPEKRRRPEAALMLEHQSYVGGLDDAGLAAIVDAWTDTDAWAR